MRVPPPPPIPLDETARLRALHTLLLMDSALDPREHTARWDGRNDRGAAVASGLYILRLDAGDVSETRPLVLIR